MIRVGKSSIYKIYTRLVQLRIQCLEPNKQILNIFEGYIQAG